MPAVSRRHSIQALSAALVGASLPRAAALAQQPYHFGYAAITWGGALERLASVQQQR